MLISIKHFIKVLIVPGVYVGGFLAMGISVFNEAKWGFFLLVFLIPQPNVWIKFHEYPSGKDFLDFLFLAVLFGMIIQKKGFARTNNSTTIILFVLLSYLALWNSSIRFSLPLPFSHSNFLLYDWKNYAQMICMYFLALNIAKDEKEHKIIVTIMSVVVMLIGIRSYRNFHPGASFNWLSRSRGPFWAIGLGANHFGAFLVRYCSAFLGLSLCIPEKTKKWLYGGCALFGIPGLLFSYSRGAYLGALAVLTFFGVFKKKALLIAVFSILMVWNVVLPDSVVDRITMTRDSTGNIDNSASHRLIMWQHAISLFKQQPLFGVGFGGFGFTVPEEENITDTHNFFVKILSEQGIIGFLFLVLLFFKAFQSGWRLFRTALSPFEKGLGLGFTGSILGCVVTNMFGDHFSYFATGGYLWIFWGLVDRSILNLKATSQT